MDRLESINAVIDNEIEKNRKDQKQLEKKLDEQVQVLLEKKFALGLLETFKDLEKQEIELESLYFAYLAQKFENRRQARINVLNVERQSLGLPLLQLKSVNLSGGSFSNVSSKMSLSSTQVLVNQKGKNNPFLEHSKRLAKKRRRTRKSS